MKIKTRAPYYEGIDIKTYITKPFLNKLKDDQENIGVVERAEIIGDEIELTIELSDNEIKSELLKSKKMSMEVVVK